MSFRGLGDLKRGSTPKETLQES